MTRMEEIQLSVRLAVNMLHSAQLECIIIANDRLTGVSVRSSTIQDEAQQARILMAESIAIGKKGGGIIAAGDN